MSAPTELQACQVAPALSALPAAQAARAAMFSAAAESPVAVCPDSGQVGVWAGEYDHWRFRAADTGADYFEGEVPPRH
ncbi:MAG: hypothetical protein M0T77_08110 [Actinomycetota bacterium]|nr:hypothetical protein [Actinomycetota bacterium]